MSSSSDTPRPIIVTYRDIPHNLYLAHLINLQSLLKSMPRLTINLQHSYLLSSPYLLNTNLMWLHLPTSATDLAPVFNHIRPVVVS